MGGIIKVHHGRSLELFCILWWWTHKHIQVVKLCVYDTYTYMCTSASRTGKICLRWIGQLYHCQYASSAKCYIRENWAECARDLSVLFITIACEFIIILIKNSNWKMNPEAHPCCHLLPFSQVTMPHISQCTVKTQWTSLMWTPWTGSRPSPSRRWLDTEIIWLMNYWLNMEIQLCICWTF